MADILGYIRNIKTNGWIPQNWHDTLGNGTKYAQDVNVVAAPAITGAVTATWSPQASELYLGQVGGTAFMSHAVLTRPATPTTAYDPLDGISDSVSAPSAIEFPNVNRATGMGVLLVTARLYKSTTTTSGASFRLWMYTDTPASVPLDNAAWASRWANREIGLGYIDFATPILGGDCCVFEGVLSAGVTTPVIPAARSLFSICQYSGSATYAPGASEKFDFYLRGVWV